MECEVQAREERGREKLKEVEKEWREERGRKRERKQYDLEGTECEGKEENSRRRIAKRGSKRWSGKWIRGRKKGTQ